MQTFTGLVLENRFLGMIAVCWSWLIGLEDVCGGSVLEGHCFKWWGIVVRDCIPEYKGTIQGI